MKAIAEYFRDLAANDRYFGATPPTPDAEMLQRLAEREIQRRVEARIADQGIVLRQTAEGAFHAAPAAAPTAEPVAEPVAEPAHVPAAARDLPEAAPEAAVEPAAGPAMAPVDDESVAMKLARIRSAVAASTASGAATGFATGDEAEVPAAEPAAMAEDFGYEVDTGAPMPAETEIAAAEADFDGELTAEPTATFETMLADATPANEFTGRDETAGEAAAWAEDEDAPEADADAVIAEVLAAAPAGVEPAAGPDEEAVPSAEAPVDEDLIAAFAAADAAEDAGDAADAELAAVFAAAAAEEAAAEAPAPADAATAAVGPEAAEVAADEPAPAATEPAPEPVAEDGAVMPAEAMPVAAGAAALSRRDRRRARAAADEAEAEVPAADAAAEPVAAAATEPAPEPVSESVPETAAESAPETAPDAAPEPARPHARVIRVRRGGQAEAAAAAAPVAPPLDVLILKEIDRVRDDAPATAAAPGPDAPKEPAAAGEEQPEGRAILESEATDNGAVERLMEEANNKLEGAESRRRFSAIAHLKAAVAATVADRRMKGKDIEAPAAAAEDATDPYREDLSRAVRPRRPVGEGHATTQRPTVETRPTPLVLVTEQRIDNAADLRSDPSLVRPRRISASAAALGDDEDGDAEDLPPISPAEAKSFAEFAERLGATNLPELLEAAAAYTAAVEGRPHFSRPQILSKVAYVAEEDAYNREAGLRSFGMLLRQGKIQKVRRGQFIITDQSRFIEEARRAAR